MFDKSLLNSKATVKGFIKKHKSATKTSDAPTGRLFQEMDSMSFTENGAPTYNTSGSGLLDLFAMGGSLRKRSEEEIIKMFESAYKENGLYAIRLLFYLRDIRGGLGEKRTARLIFNYIANTADSDFVSKIIEHVDFYGRYDDLFYFNNPKIMKDVILPFIKNRLMKDMDAEHPSLCAKWMPSCNTSSKTTRALATQVRKHLKLSEKEYRQMLSKLRKKIDIIETKMTQQQWENINYSTVPSNAMKLYRKAFYKHDETRFKKFIEQVKSKDPAVKDPKVKINTQTLLPYEIIRDVMSGKHDDALEAMWNNLPDWTNGKNAICVVDTSGSMSGLPIQVALSLGMYFAERNKCPQFQNRFITFSQNPKLQKIEGDTLYSKVRNLDNAQWDMNTNLEAVFDLILNTAKSNNLTQEDLPETIYIISDMEFDSSTRNTDKTLFDAISKDFKEAGYTRPSLVFWNVNSRNNNTPVKMHTSGTALISGSSPTVFKMVVSGNLDPYQIMIDTLNGERYARIK